MKTISNRKQRSNGHSEKISAGLREEDALPGALGLSASSVSRKFKKVSAKRLAELNTRDLSCYDFIGLVLDGKSCAKELMFIALGITMDG